MNKDSVFKLRINKEKLVLEIEKDFIINDFDGFTEDFKVKKNRKKKFLEEFGEILIEQLINDEVFQDIYEQLSEGENVKCLEEEN